MIDAASGYHQLRVHEESQLLLTITTNMGRFTFKSLPQGICNSADLWNLMTDGNSRIDSELNLEKNMDDWMLYARDLVKLKEKLEKFLQFAAKKNLKLKTKKFVLALSWSLGGLSLLWRRQRIRNTRLSLWQANDGV